ncbi:asparaginase domain-containing protein [Pseudomonas benzenivorans]|uniref:Asparaginase n=1 Tax=Pseudomonas benzenivorans TaxID=556533 RepID=A0ABY5H8Q6_9PSED|nr:asparaginase domain-containing protein [Pseudomonas benzenivorans]UTW08227.1 asparaginase [Pseudomonas benzenivorans]
MNIAIINTGGTISCVGDPLAPMTASAFAEASEQLLNPILQQQFPDLSIGYLTEISFPESATKTLDSTNLQPTDWCIMAQGILENYAAYDGFVILHGTDSMDFSGAALAFLLNSFDANGYGTAVLSKPVIITGSQVPLYYQAGSDQALSLNFNTDAYQNLCGAVAAAQCGIAEVCVYFHNHLYRGNRAVKTNASQFDAFSSPNYPALAKYGIELTLNSEACLPGPVHSNLSLDTPTVLAKQQSQVSSIQACINTFPIVQLNAFPAPYSLSPPSAFLATLIDAVVKAGACGIILESYGEGNFPSGNPDTPSAGAIYQALNQANQSGVNLVDCTQVLAGTVNNSAYAAGAWLPQVGALSPADMTPMAALAKLMILMASAASNGWTRQQVQSLMQTNLAGEMLSVNYLDSRTSAELLPNQSISALDGSATLTNTSDQGPLLLASDQSTPLWRLPITIQPGDLPGRLRMQDDGNLVFYNRNNQAIWASDTGRYGGASSRLVISGHYASSAQDNSLLLQVYDYSSMVSACQLYP